MKCDELKQKYSDITGPYYGYNEVNEAIAELKKKLMPCLNGDCILTCEVVEKYGKENAELKQELSEKDKDIAYWREEYDKETQLTDALKDEIESLKASHYAESVDAGMRERRLRRALWLARAERAIAESEYWYGHCSGMYYINAMEVPDEEDNPYKRVKDTNIGWYKTWMKVETKCREKAEEYK